MKNFKKLITFTLIAALACAVLLPGCSGGGKNINLDNYVVVTFDGYNGSGTATATLDSSKISENYDGKVKVNDPIYEEFGVGEVIGDVAYVSVEPNSGLSNGDTVTLKWDVEESYIKEILNCNVSYSSMEYTVEGLEEIGTVDVFEGVDVSFSGLAPNGEASVVTAGEFGTDGYGAYTWEVSPSSGLSNGDTVTVTFTPGNDFINEYGAMPEYTEKEFTVSGLENGPHYVDSLSEIPEDAMGKMISQGEDVFNAYVAKVWNVATLTSLDYIGAYFLDAKSDNTTPQNLICTLYEYHANQSGDNVVGYWFCEFSNAVILPDGTFSLDYSDYYAPTSSYVSETFMHGTATYAGYSDVDSMFNNLVTANIDKYTYESTIQ